MKQQEQSPAARQQLGNQAVPLGTAAPKVEVPPAPVVSSLTIAGDRIEYAKPTIFLMGDEFIDLTDHRTQTKKWTPGRAYVSQGMLIIDEYGVSLPVSYVKTIRYEKKVVS